MADWLLATLSGVEPEEVFYLESLSKCVTVRDAKTLGNRDLRISNIEDSYVYIDTNVKHISIVNCVNTTIMVAAVSKVCTLDKCESVTLSVAANFLRIGNSIDCKVYAFTTSGPPVLFGDNRSVTLAPHNVSYAELLGHLKNAGLESEGANTAHFEKPIVVRGDKEKNWTLMPPRDFFRLPLP